MTSDMRAADLRKLADVLDELTGTGDRHGITLTGHAGVYVDLGDAGKVRVDERRTESGVQYVAVVAEAD